MKIVVLGAGAWGTALAVAAAKAHVPGAAAQHHVTLWARDTAQITAMGATMACEGAGQPEGARQNAAYLPGVLLPPALQLSAVALSALPTLVQAADLVIIATPMAALRGLFEAITHATPTLSQSQGAATGSGAHRPAPPSLLPPVVWLCKGFEADTGLLAHEIQMQIAPQLRAGVLSGPSFAQEVAQGRPTALVAASSHVLVRESLVAAFHSASLRVYANEDITGVEVGGAVKNVLAIATGLCDGLGLGLNARAALITRGLAEMTRFGMALGARAETFMGLSGLGDLVLTATGDLSRNRNIGLLLAQGRSLEQAVASLGHVAEGVYSARTVVQRAHALGVDMPIAQAVVALLDGGIGPQDAVAQLMAREARFEA